MRVRDGSLGAGVVQAARQQVSVLTCACCWTARRTKRVCFFVTVRLIVAQTSVIDKAGSRGDNFYHVFSFHSRFEILEALFGFPRVGSAISGR